MCEFDKEIWMDVSNFIGIYQISNLGRLKSFKDDKNGVILSNKNSKGDYLRCVLSNKHIKKTKLLHRLVYETFVSDIKKGYEIDHIDSNKQNNAIENLQCLSTKEHAKKTIIDYPNRCLAMNLYNKNRTRRVYQYTIDMVFVNSYYSAKEAFLKTGVCARNITQVASKTEYKPGLKRSQAGGFIWKYKKL